MAKGITVKKILWIVSLIILFVIIIGYGIWKGQDLIFGIKLEISGIQNNVTVKNSVLELSGIAYHAVSININGRTVSVEENGEWHDTISLLRGYNIISISAKDKFGREKSKIFTINYDAPPEKEIEINPIIDTNQATSTATSTKNTSTSTGG